MAEAERLPRYLAITKSKRVVYFKETFGFDNIQRKETSENVKLYPADVRRPREAPRQL